MYYVLGTFLVVFLAITGISTYQEDQEGVRKDVESIKEREVSRRIVPSVLGLFDSNPPEFGEENDLVKDKLAERLTDDLVTTVTAMKCGEIAKAMGRAMIWCGAIGVLTTIVFIFMVACLGSGLVLNTAAFGVSFFLFSLCGFFWTVRRRSIDRVRDIRDMAEGM